MEVMKYLLGIFHNQKVNVFGLSEKSHLRTWLGGAKKCVFTSQWLCKKWLKISKSGREERSNVETGWIGQSKKREQAGEKEHRVGQRRE